MYSMIRDFGEKLEDKLWRILVTDIQPSLDEIFVESDVKQRLIRSMERARTIHNSRTSYINYLRRFVISEKYNDCMSHIALLVALSEAVIHDIDSRIDGHLTEREEIIDASHIEVYNSIIPPILLQKFVNSVVRWPLKDLKFKRIYRGIVTLTFDFINRIRKVPEVENKIMNTQNESEILECLISLTKLFPTQSKYYAQLTFLPPREVGIVDKIVYQDMLQVAYYVHLVDKAVKDLEDLSNDETKNLYNPFLTVRKFPNIVYPYLGCLFQLFENYSRLSKSISEKSVYCKSSRGAELIDFLSYWNKKIDDIRQRFR